LSDFKDGQLEKECHVPHIVRSSNGVRIETSCSSGNSGVGESHSHSGSNALRLTGDHLLYTLNGLRAASTIVAGDVLFGDMAESQHCQVIRVTNEDSEQLYLASIVTKVLYSQMASRLPLLATTIRSQLHG
jgi:hypothetical protein